MPTLGDIVAAIEERCPLYLAEPWDNCGWQVGDPSGTAKGVLVAVEATEATVEEAHARGCNLLITHHPILFHPLRTIGSTTYPERTVRLAIELGVAIYAAHTNADAAATGLNYLAAQRLGLRQIVPLTASVYAPHGLGVVGEWCTGRPLAEVLAELKIWPDVERITHSKPLDRLIRRVAIVTGSGGSMLPQAIAAGADLLLTGEAKYNDYLDAAGKLVLACIGHFESETIARRLFIEIISLKFPNFVAYEAQSDLNPICYL